MNSKFWEELNKGVQKEKTFPQLYKKSMNI
jgi:hypothetical protein